MACGNIGERFEAVSVHERLIRKKDFADLFRTLNEKFAEVEELQRAINAVFEDIKHQATSYAVRRSNQEPAAAVVVMRQADIIAHEILQEELGADGRAKIEKASTEMKELSARLEKEIAELSTEINGLREQEKLTIIKQKRSRADKEQAALQIRGIEERIESLEGEIEKELEGK